HHVQPRAQGDAAVGPRGRARRRCQWRRDPEPRRFRTLGEKGHSASDRRGRAGPHPHRRWRRGRASGRARTRRGASRRGGGLRVRRAGPPALRRSDECRPPPDERRRFTPPALPTRAIRCGTLFAATGAPPLRDALVIVTDGRIAAVGPAATTPIPPGAAVLDLTDRLVTPDT